MQSMRALARVRAELIQLQVLWLIAVGYSYGLLGKPWIAMLDKSIGITPEKPPTAHSDA
ncbi:protein of unknown function [Hyphomicrobium sp. MC1]|nr:protein of unknown function [Hyphomicrobium sp. MC1]